MERLYIALDVAEALVYLHCHIEPPIVHCDIKPSNILLDDNMVAHVTDFGLAKILHHEALKENSGIDQSSSLVIKGTIGYVAPGQLLLSKLFVICTDSYSVTCFINHSHG